MNMLHTLHISQKLDIISLRIDFKVQITITRNIIDTVSVSNFDDRADPTAPPLLPFPIRH